MARSESPYPEVLMPFEPLQTDEKIEGPIKKQPDMDSVMLAGCTAFLVTAFGSYALSVWPFFLFHETGKLVQGLMYPALIGLLPALLLGAISSRKFGLAGACGFIGGAMTTGVFLFLRIQQALLGLDVPELPRPEYPTSWSWIIPLSWIVLCLAVALLFSPKATSND